MKRLTARTQPWPLWREAMCPEDRDDVPDELPEGLHYVGCDCGATVIESEDVDSVRRCAACAS